MNKENKEWFKVIEIADLLGFSKVTVYTKIKGLNSDVVQTLQKKEKGITYYNYEIIDMLREINTQQNTPPVDIAQEEIASDTINDKYMDLYIEELKSEIEFLKEQVKELNKKNEIQFQELNNRLAQEQDLNKNNQILQLRQPQNIKALEDHFEALDNKLINIREQMQQRKEEQDQQPKGFFKGLFKKQGI